MSDDKRDVNAILGGIGDSLSKLGKDVVDLVKVGADKAQDAYSDYQSKAASASKDEASKDEASKDDTPKEDMAEADTVEEADTAEEVVEEADTAEEVVEEADTTVEEDTSEDNSENKS